MGGSAGMESTEGSGSLFWVDLPLGIAGSAAETGAMSVTHPVRVLIVDRHAVTRQILSDQLSYWGFDTVEAVDGEAATSAIQSQKPGFDLIICESASSVKTKIPTIRMAASWDHAPKSHGRPGLFIKKPIRRSHLVDAITLALGPEVLPISRTPVAGCEGDRDRQNLGLRILVAEDNAVNALILEETLRGLGCETLVVANGVEALKEVRTGTYDLILMDVQMPEMDGFEATIRIRALEEGTGSSVPIIALTAHAQREDREKCLQVGMDDYLSKPIVRQDLVNKLRLWSGKVQA
jgi:CheY-like chemotaxis protein